MTIAATSNIVIAQAAFDVAITEYANERLTLRKGTMVIREHPKVR
ncbi:MAG TPA: hypothetical protein VGJ20_24500 [Xanthobacteraceae bacterium]